MVLDVDKKIRIIGLGVTGDGVSKSDYKYILGADVLVAGKRQLAAFPGFKGEKIYITKNLKQTLSQLRLYFEKGLKIVVLGSGDPLLFGIGSTLIDFFGADFVEVVPAVSSPQAALALLGLPGNNSLVLSRHGQKLDDLSGIMYFSSTVILTDDGAAPSLVIKEILRILPEAKDWEGAVCQSLGMPEELIEKGKLSSLTNRDYHQKNLLVVKNPNPKELKLPEPVFGRDNACFVHSRGLITHPEVRAVSLSKLGLQSAKTMWDMGAGSGSVGIEAALLAPMLLVFSVEKNDARVGDIKQNIKRLKAFNVNVKHGNALDFCDELPQPDRVFIGGGGKDLSELLLSCYDKLRPGGLIVVNTVTVDSFGTVNAFARENKVPLEAVSIQVSRMSEFSGYRLMRPENNVTVFRIKK